MRFGGICEGLKNFEVRRNRGKWIDVWIHGMSLLNHGRRLIRSQIWEIEELKMNRRSVMTAVVLGASLLMSEAVYATPVAVGSPMHAMFSRDKLVKFNVRNLTDAPIKVKVGDVEMTLPPGKDTPMKLALGTKIVVEETSTHYTQGSVLTVVNPGLDNATLRLD